MSEDNWWKTADDMQYRERRTKLGRRMLTLAVVVGTGGLIGLAGFAFTMYRLWVSGAAPTLFLGVIILVIAGLGLSAAVGLGVLITGFVVGRRHDVTNTLRGRWSTVTTRDGIGLHVETEGDNAASRTVVFLHGAASSTRVWHHQRGKMPHGTKEIYYDARGHGRSDGHKLDLGVPGVRQLADDLGAVIDAEAPRGDLMLVGHAMGGMTVFALAAIRPDIVSRVRGLVIVASTPGPARMVASLGLPGLLTPITRIVQALAAPTLGLVGLVPRFVLRLLGYGPYLILARWLLVSGDASPEAWRLSARLLRDTGPKRLAHPVAAVFEHDERSSLLAISQIPTTVVAGEKDRLVALSSYSTWVDKLPQAELVTAPGTGHLAMLERPAWFTEQVLALVSATDNDSEIDASAAAHLPYLWKDYRAQLPHEQVSWGSPEVPQLAARQAVRAAQFAVTMATETIIDLPRVVRAAWRRAPDVSS